MLKPAQLYEEELRRKMVSCWHDPAYMYYSGWTGDEVPKLPDNYYDEHNFVSVDKDDNVIGYIAYHVSWSTMSAYNFGAISFDRGNLLFGRDLFTAIDNLFNRYHMNRIQWRVIADNPVAKSYKRFIMKHGGVECSHLRQVARLLDGQLHDAIEYEILAKDYYGANAHNKGKEECVFQTIALLDKLKRDYLGTTITIETQSKSVTCCIADANIYDNCTGDIVIDAE
jgi:hypothetical protein